MRSLLAASSAAILTVPLLSGCAAAGVPLTIERAKSRTSSDSPPSSASPTMVNHERPFEPRAGVVILGPGGRVIVMQLWEGNARPESACPSGLPAMSPSTFRDVATLHVMPSPGPSAPSRANGYRFGEDTFAAFSGRLFEQNLRVSGVKLPAKLEAGTTIVVPVDVSDVGGTSVYDGRVKMFVCDLGK